MDSLYHINGKIKDFIRLHTDPETGELINVDNVIGDLETLEINRQEKQKNIILYYKNLEGESDIIDSEIQRLKELKVLNEKRREGLKNILENSMKAFNEKELDFVTCKAKFKKNPPALIIDDRADLSAYTIIKTSEQIDKNAIKEDLKKGKEIKGCMLESTERLEIK